MPETLNSSDDLEALLADLSEIDLDLIDEPVNAVETPVIETAPAPVEVKVKRTRKSKEAVEAPLLPEEEFDLDELAELASSTTPVHDANPPVGIEPAIVLSETVTTPPAATQDDEIDALLAAAEEAPPVVIYTDPTPTVKAHAPRYEEAEERFVPESDLKTFIDIDRLKADLDFTETNISLAMTRQASLFAHYSTLAHQAQFQADRADQQVDLIEAQLDQKYRDAFVTAGQKVTENMIKAAIIKDDKYQKAMLRKNEAKAIAEMVKSAADSFRHRRDMLIQVGADLRQQAQGEVRTKEKEHPGHAALEALGRRA